MRRDPDLWDVLAEPPQSCAWHGIGCMCMELAAEYELVLYVFVTFFYRLPAAHPFPVMVRENAAAQDRSAGRTDACCLLFLQKRVMAFSCAS